MRETLIMHATKHTFGVIVELSGNPFRQCFEFCVSVLCSLS